MKQFLEDPTLGLVRSKRPAQIQMYEAVSQTVLDGGIAAIQAGTGTGKSYAYILALLNAVKEGVIRRGIIATAKKTLQSQLFRKDLPAVENIVGDLDYASLKGKANYLCQLRYHEFVDSGAMGQYPSYNFAAFDKWAEEDPIGDLSSYDEDVPFAWAVRVTECVKDHCPFAGGCGYYNNRLNAKEAQILIVNHSLLALDFQLGRGKVLGEYDAVVIDEAHQFSDFATKAYSFEMYAQQAEQLERMFQGDNRVKFPEQLVSSYNELFTTLSRFDSGPFPLNAPAVKTALNRVGASLNELKSRLQGQGVNVDPTAAIEEALAIGGTPGSESGDISGARRKGKLTAAGSVVAKVLKAIETIKEDREDYLSLIERREYNGAPRVSVTPLDVGSMIAPALRGCGKVVLTSATLKTTDGFGYLRRGLGVLAKEITAELDLQSPFSYKDHSGLWVSPTAILPAQNNKSEVLMQQVKEIDELLTASKGGAFILCASREDMNTIASELLLKKRAEYRVLSQSDNVDKDIAEFGYGYNNVLVGVKSIWEGVDVPGMKLRMVIIPRLPFPNAKDFLHNAKKDLAKARYVASGEDPSRIGIRLFNDFDVQMVAMDLAQGAGRLLRSESDFGLLVVLDPRLHPGAKVYTNALRKLLPHPPYTSKADVLRMIGIFNNLTEKEKKAKGIA